MYRGGGKVTTSLHQQCGYQFLVKQLKNKKGKKKSPQFTGGNRKKGAAVVLSRKTSKEGEN